MASKKKRKTVSVIDFSAEKPTRERLAMARAHGGVIIDEIPVATCGGRVIKRVSFRDTCPLDRYHGRGRVDDRQREAGRVFAERWYAAFRSPFKVSDPSRDIRGSSGSEDFDARKRFYDFAYGSGIARKGDQGIVWTPSGRVVMTVCGDESPACGGRQMDYLREGLDAVADYLKLPHEKRSCVCTR